MKKLILFLSLIISIVTFSETTYFQVGVTPTLNLFEGEEVHGVRVPILFGSTDKIVGLDFNVFTGEVNEFTGLQGGIFLGAGIFSKVNTKFRGVGLNIVNLQGGDSKGLLLGGFNMTNEFSGFKLGLFNYSKGHAGGEVGVVNYSDEVYVQAGFLNVTKDIKGIQFGLLNFAENGILPVMPLINFSFGKK